MLGRASRGVVVQQALRQRKPSQRPPVSVRSFLEASPVATTSGSTEQESLGAARLASANSAGTVGMEVVKQNISASAATSTNPAHRKLIQRKSKEQTTKEKEVKAPQPLEKAASAVTLNKGKGRELEMEGETLDGEWLNKEAVNKATLVMGMSSKGDLDDSNGSGSTADYVSKAAPPTNTLLLTRSGSNTDCEQASTSTSSSASALYNSSASDSSSGPTAKSPTATDSQSSLPVNGDISFLPFVPLESVPIPHIRHPFNTNSFVAQLERTGEFNRGTSEEIMRATKALLTIAEDRAGRDLVAKADLENEAYLFSAALAELRTEVQMTARTDGIALRSMNSQLQREVDSLAQKMREDMNSLKNDNQLDLNTRKEEGSQDISAMEQKILDLNSKFTLLLGDTRAALEANKWIQTRRSIVMIAALAITVMAYVSTAPEPPPPAPPRPPSADDLGLKQIEEPESETGLFSGWLSGSSSAIDKVESKTRRDKDIAPNHMPS